MNTAPTAPGASFTEGAVEADGFTIRFFEAGEGDPLVVLHGAGGPRFSVALDILAERHRVILIEMPGWGEQSNDRHTSFAEMAVTIDQATRALGLSRYHLLGTSLGGAVATYVALDFPERLVSLLLDAPATFRAGATLPSPDLPLDRLRRMFRCHPEREPVWQPPDPAAMAPTRPLVRRLYDTTPEYDERIVARLAECHVRTLVIFGDKDGVFPPDNGRTYRRSMPNCQYVLIHQAAHDIQGDRPEAFAELVSDFLSRGLEFLLPEESTRINA